MFRAINGMGYFAARSTAYKIIFSIKDLAILNETDEINCLNWYIDIMANALKKVFCYKQYQGMDYETKETIQTCIAQHLYKVSKKSRVTHFDMIENKLKCVDSRGLVYSKWKTFFGNGYEIDEIRLPLLFSNVDDELVAEIRKALLDALSTIFWKKTITLSTAHADSNSAFYKEEFPKDILLLIQKNLVQFYPNENELINLNLLKR